MKKTLILLCLLALTAVLLVSCGTPAGTTETTTEATDPGMTPDGDLLFLKDGASVFQVTYPMGANTNPNTGTAFKEVLTVLRKSIKTSGYTGTLFPIKSDEGANKEPVDAPEYEILIGDTNRAESKAIVDTLAYNEAVIRVVGKKVCIIGANDTLSIQALYQFIEEYLSGDGTAPVVIPTSLDKKVYLDLTNCRETGMTYAEMADQVLASFNKRYWQSNRLPKETNWFWDAAEMLETYVDVYEATGRDEDKTRMTQFATAFLRQHGGDWSWNEYNDDIMWACIAMARITLLTGEEKWIDYSKKNFDKVWESQVDTKLGGGMYWRKDQQSKNACVNGPAAIAACLLGQHTKDNTYYDKAKQLIDWEVSKLYEVNTGKVYDNINIQNKKSDWSSTYNQGTFIGACTYLWKHFNDETYLGYANKAAEFAMKKLTNGGILDNGEASTTNGDLPGFKGILTRWLYRLAKETNNIDYLVFLQNNAVVAFKNQNSDGLIWTNWKGKTPEAETLTRDNGYVVFGMSTAVALMYNCQQWWE